MPHMFSRFQGRLSIPWQGKLGGSNLRWIIPVPNYQSLLASLSVLYSLDMYKYVYTPTGYIMNIIHEYWYEYLWTCVSIYIYEYVHPSEGTYPTMTSIYLLVSWPDLLHNQPLASCEISDCYRHPIPKIWKSFRMFIASTVENPIENIKPTNNHLAGKIEVTNFAEKKSWYEYNWQMSRAQIG